MGKAKVCFCAFDLGITPRFFGGAFFFERFMNTMVDEEENKRAGTEGNGESIAVTDTPKDAKNGEKSSFFKTRFTGKRIAVMAIFTALSYLVSLIPGIPIPLFGAKFLKLDFSSVFILLMSFLLGPLEGVLVCLLKETLCGLTSDTFWVGEFANFIIVSSYLIIPSIAYRYRRTFKTVLIGVGVSCVVATGVAMLANCFLMFPCYEEVFGSILGLSASAAWEVYWPGVLLFNLIKTVSVGLITMLLYKRLSNFFKKWKV